MNTLLIIIAIVGVAGLAYYLLLKTNKVKDENGNMIPDSVEEAATKVKKQATLVKEEVKEFLQKSTVTAKGTNVKPATKKSTEPKVEKTVVVESKNSRRKKSNK